MRKENGKYARTSGRLPQNDLDQQRFGIYFFVARHPEGQEETPDEKETTVGIWVTSPRQALQENSTGEIVLSPPTLKTLEDLSSYQTPEDVFRTIRPLLTKVSDETVTLFPWNPEYERFTRGELLTPADHGKQSGPADNTTRVIFRNGRWISRCKEV